MSRFFSEKYKNLSPYVPGEQPQDMQYVKLNTNESPFPVSPKALEFAKDNTRALNLYSDPDCRKLRNALAETFDVGPDEVIPGNGSDELLNYALMAFCDDKHPAAYPEISYGFYPVIAGLNLVKSHEIPLNDDFTINVNDYKGLNETIFIANPNAPTGIALSPAQIEEIIVSNPDSVVLIDEAYVDFGAESCIPLVKKYKNLIVTQTFSKSRSFAGARLGFAIGDKELISDMNTLRNSCNPYNINNLTEAVALGILADPEYEKANSRIIIENREYLTKELEKRGFEVLPSCANFIFAQTAAMDGGELYQKLKAEGVLVRHFTKERIRNFNRITIGTKEQLNVLLERIDKILKG